MSKKKKTKRNKVAERKWNSPIGLRKRGFLQRIKDAVNSIEYPEDSIPETDLSGQYVQFKLESEMRMRSRANAHKASQKAEETWQTRQRQHDEDMRIQDIRSKWEWGDPMDCWDRTEEEIEFGLFPTIPEEPEEINRFDLLDVEE